jgi:hypothetical protein
MAEALNTTTTVAVPSSIETELIPILHACQTFTQLVKVFTTTQHPIDFTARRITVSEIKRFKVNQSMETRQVLLQIYNLYFPLFAYSPVELDTLKRVYLNSIVSIHSKFETTQTTPVFQTHFEDTF